MWQWISPLLILTIVGVASWLWVRSRQNLLNDKYDLQIVHAVRLGYRNRLLVIRFDGSDMLVGETPSGISLLHVKAARKDSEIADEE